MIKTTTPQKLLLCLFGTCLALGLLELGLRGAGISVHWLQTRAHSVGRNDRPFPPEIRILTLGESTTSGLFDENGSWPEMLETLLNTDSPQQVYRVINEGVQSYNTAYIALELEDNLKKHKPDIVITMMGINDSAITVRYTPESNGVTGEYWWTRLRLVKFAGWLLSRMRNGTDQNKARSVPQDAGESPPKPKVGLLSATCTDRSYVPDISAINKVSFEIAAERETQARLTACIERAASFGHRAEQLMEQNKWLKAEQMWKQSLALIYRHESVTGLIEASKMLQRDPHTLRQYLKSLGVDVVPDYGTTSWNITQDHYRYLAKTLKARGIQYFVMQYPTISVEPLRAIFPAGSNIQFISNRANFTKALSVYPYDKLFVDPFARGGIPPFRGHWGHTTYLGNMLIAQNVKRHIEAYVQRGSFDPNN